MNDTATAASSIEPNVIYPEIETAARARFFTNYPVERRRVLVDSDGTVRVWDHIAGHFTLRHNLSKAVQTKIARAARKHLTPNQ